jgi:hypothetical protein
VPGGIVSLAIIAVGLGHRHRCARDEKECYKCNAPTDPQTTYYPNWFGPEPNAHQHRAEQLIGAVPVHAQLLGDFLEPCVCLMKRIVENFEAGRGHILRLL